METSAAKNERVKIFISGNSQAIRLPKKFRLPGQTARIERKGKSLIITPDEDVWARLARGIEGLAKTGFWKEFARDQPAKADSRRRIFP